MSTVAQDSKAVQLARTRRNQQRCRERKRTQIIELERQVETLNAKIRECEPCVSSCQLKHEGELETAVRENAARRDLLLSLGFDNETQQRFIQSGVKHQAVYQFLQGDRDHRSASQSVNEQHATTPLTPAAHYDAQFSETSVEHADLGASRIQATAAVDNSARLAEVGINAQSVEDGLAIENWLYSAKTLEQFPRHLMSPPDNLSWLAEPVNTQGNCAHNDAVNSYRLTDLTLAPETGLKSAWNDGHGEMQLTTTIPDNNRLTSDQSMERCFLNTVVQFEPGESSIVCSTALSLIFRNNRKGLSMAELQEQLKPGMRAPSTASGECRIEDSVLFTVLADISN